MLKYFILILAFITSIQIGYAVDLNETIKHTTTILSTGLNHIDQQLAANQTSTICSKQNLKQHVNKYNPIGCHNTSADKIPLEMGINLSAPQAESPAVANSVPFADIFKTARPFESDNPALVGQQNGWPCFTSAQQKISTHILESAKANSIPSGLYPVHLRGDVNLQITGAQLQDCPTYKKVATGVTRKCIKIDMRHDLSSQGITITVKPKGKVLSNKKKVCLENLKIILPGNYEDKFIKNPSAIIFNQDYLDYLKPFKVLRMMNLIYASPRLPSICQKIQATSIKQNPHKYTWNTLSPKAILCINNPKYNRTSEHRAQLTDATWGISSFTDKRKWRGVPIEVLVELTKQTGGDPWLNIPHNASDDYIRLMAKKFAQLKIEHPKMKVHIEYSNEVWNGQFWGAKYITANAKDPYPNISRQDLINLNQKYLQQRQQDLQRLNNQPLTHLSPQQKQKYIREHTNAINQRINKLRKVVNQKLQAKMDAEVHFYLHKSLNTFSIFEQEFQKELEKNMDKQQAHQEMEHSLVRTLGTKQGDSARTNRMLKYLQKTQNLHHLDAIATATYVEGCWGNSKTENLFCQKYTKQQGYGMLQASTPKKVVKQLLDPHNPKGVHAVVSQIKDQQQVLKKYKQHKLALVAYEGGQHLTILNLPKDIKQQLDVSPQAVKKYKLSKQEIRRRQHIKQQLIQKLHAANNSDSMGQLYSILYEGWKKHGGKSHVNFIMAQSYSQYGSFGISQTLQDANTAIKYQTAKQYAQIFCREQNSTIQH